MYIDDETKGVYISIYGLTVISDKTGKKLKKTKKIMELEKNIDKKSIRKCNEEIQKANLKNCHTKFNGSEFVEVGTDKYKFAIL